MMRVLAAAVLATVSLLALPACREASDEDPLDALVAFAQAPSDDTWKALPLADVIRLGLGDRLLERRSARELREPGAWELEAELFRAGVGPWSALRVLGDPDEPLAYREGSYERCASPPGPPPPEVSDLRRLSIQPREWESCLQWFAVDVFVTEDDRIAAVTLDMWEP